MLHIEDINSRKRFEDKFILGADNECWNWIASTNASGYGTFSYKGRCVLAHRFAYSQYNSIELSKDICVMHKCDNPICVNYKNHLILGTRLDNNLDRHLKQRDGRGESNRHAKLNEPKVLEIRELFLQGWREADLARKYGVAPNTINHILHRKSWKHI